MEQHGRLDLIISRLPGLKPKDRVRLCEKIDSEDDFIRFTKSDIENILGRALKYFWDIDAIRAMADHDAKVCRMRSISFVSWRSAAYPPIVREIYDPPAVLFFRGQFPPADKPLLGMVGTRRPSCEALSQAYSLARDLGSLGVSVVSGLALGIDAISHRGNLEGGSPTFAVLGSGVDEVYPSSNRPLANRILDTGGAILSEYPPGTVPHKWNFPARNRIVCALSRSVLIVEAPARSGALITAELALDYGKDLWVASSGIYAEENPLYDRRGTIKLAQDGAEIISRPADVLEKWGMEMAANNAASRKVNRDEIPAGNAGGKVLAAALAEYLDIDL